MSNFHFLHAKNSTQNPFFQIRTVGVVFYSLCISSIAFVADKFFPIMLETIHLHGCLLFGAINCLIGLIFIKFMKETRGQSLDSVSPSETQYKDNN